jgi:MFS family permease
MTPPPAESGVGLGKRAVGANPFSWRFTAPMFLGSALNPVNSSLIATALVPIAHGLHVSLGRTVALVSALYLASAIAQPTGGKLAEVFGPRRVFLTGILLVLAGGVIGGLGDSLTTLLAARVLIGIGTSGAYPSAMLMIRRRANSVGLEEPPGSVLAGLTIAASATAALGLPIGGVLVNAFGWRSVFFANVPVTLVALVMVISWLPRDPAYEGSRSARDIANRIDLGGIAGFAGAMTGLLVFLNSLPHPQWAWLVVAAVFAIGLVPWELRSRRPFLDLRLLLSNLALTRTYLRFALSSLCIYTVLYGLSQWLEAGRGLSAEDAGLLLLPMSGIAVFITRPISRRNLIRGPLIVSAICSLLGAVGLLVLSTGSSEIAIVGITLLFGITLGTFSSSNQTALYEQAEGSQIATAAGLMRTFGYIGSIASAAIISIVFHTSVTDHGLHTIGAIMIGLSILGLVLVLGDRRLRSTPLTDSTPETPRAVPSLPGSTRFDRRKPRDDSAVPTRAVRVARLSREGSGHSHLGIYPLPTLACRMGHGTVDGHHSRAALDEP